MQTEAEATIGMHVGQYHSLGDILEEIERVEQYRAHHSTNTFPLKSPRKRIVPVNSLTYRSALFERVGHEYFRNLIKISLFAFYLGGAVLNGMADHLERENDKAQIELQYDSTPFIKL